MRKTLCALHSVSLWNCNNYPALFFQVSVVLIVGVCSFKQMQVCRTHDTCSKSAIRRAPKTTIHVLQVLASCGLRYQAFHTRPQSAAVQSQQTPKSGEHVVGIGPFLFTFSQQRSERDLRIGCIHFWPIRALLLFITASTAAHPQLRLYTTTQCFGCNRRKIPVT